MDYSRSHIELLTSTGVGHLNSHIRRHEELKHAGWESFSARLSPRGAEYPVVSDWLSVVLNTFHKYHADTLTVGDSLTVVCNRVFHQDAVGVRDRCDYWLQPVVSGSLCLTGNVPGTWQTPTKQSWKLQKPQLATDIGHRIVGLMLEWEVVAALAVTTQTFFQYGSLTEVGDDKDLLSGPTLYLEWYGANPLTGRRWTLNDLFFMEVGLTGEATVNQLTVYVVVEPLPFRTLPLDGQGQWDQWKKPSSMESSPTQLLIALDNLRAGASCSLPNEKVSFRTLQPIGLPVGWRIDGVGFHIRVMGNGVVTLICQDEQELFNGPYCQLEIATSSVATDHDVAFPTRPKFNGALWDEAGVAQAEWGLQNIGEDPNTLNHAHLDVFASPEPEEIIRMHPTGNGVYNDMTQGAPALGEPRWQDVRGWSPDLTSWLTGNASTSPLYQSSVVHVSERDWINLRWRAVVRSTGSAWVCPLLVKLGQTYVGRPLRLDSFDWVECWSDFWLNPFTGLSWEITDLADIEVGLVVMKGSVDCCWYALDGEEVTRNGLNPSECVPNLFPTVEGGSVVSMANPTGLTWKVDTFSVGRGGYDLWNPGRVLGNNPTDTTLADEVWSGAVTKASSVGQTARYWCVIPPDVITEPIGEFMLWARVLDPGLTAYQINDLIPLATAHIPCAFHSWRNIKAVMFEITYGYNAVSLWHSEGGLHISDQGVAATTYQRSEASGLTVAEVITGGGTAWPFRSKEETLNVVESVRVVVTYNRAARDYLHRHGHGQAVKNP